MEYDVPLVNKLLEPGVMLDVGGVEVECKPVPDGDGSHAMDPRAHKMELAMAEKMASRQGPPPTIEEMRGDMGGFNYNLCRRELYTRYIVVPTSVGDVPVWCYYPRRQREMSPALMYVHGGAFFGGTPFTVENPCRCVADRGDCVVFNVEYGLAPEHPFPIPCTQVYEVVCYIHDHAAMYGVDPEKLAVAGDSAGGNLCAVASLMDRDRGTHYIKAQALLYAKLTFTNHELPGYARDESAFEIVESQRHLLPGMLRIGSDESNAGDAAVYTRGEDIKSTYISPAFGDCASLPSTLFILAEYDGLRLEGEFYAKKLKAAGVGVRVLRYMGVCHGFFDALGILPQSEAAANEIAKLVNEI